MGHSEKAIAKGTRCELYAQTWFLKNDYTVLVPTTHEKPYDFVVEKDGCYERVQVKANVLFGDLVRFRNKHGANNASYSIDDYDILVGVWEDGNSLWFFRSQDINGTGKSESITVATVSGRPLREYKGYSRPKPFRVESIV